MKKKILIYVTILICIGLVYLIWEFCHYEKCPNLEISNVGHIEVTTSDIWGTIINEEKEKELLNFLNSLSLYDIGHRKIGNTAADVYVYIYNDAGKLEFEFWIYGGGRIIETVSNKRYCIEPIKVEELLDLFETFEDRDWGDREH